MANGKGLTRDINVSYKEPSTNIVDSIFGTTRDRLERAQIEAQERIAEKQLEEKAKRDNYDLFLKFEKQFPDISKKREMAESMNLTEVVTLFDNTYDFPDLKIQENSIKDFDKAETADELVALYKTIDPDGPYVDRARQSAEAKMTKSFSKIISSIDRTQYSQDTNRYGSLTTEIAGLRQQEVNFRGVFPQTELESDAEYQSRLESIDLNTARQIQGGSIIIGTGDNQQELTYAQLNERISNLDKEYLQLDKSIQDFNYFRDNKLDYAIAQYDKKNNIDSQGDGSTSSVNEDETEEVISKVPIAEFEDLSPDAIETLTSLDITEFEENAFDANPEEVLDPISSTLENISGLLTDDTPDYMSGRMYTEKELAAFPLSVDKLISEIDNIGGNISTSEALELLDSLELRGTSAITDALPEKILGKPVKKKEFDRRATLFSDGKRVDDTRGPDLEKLRDLQKRYTRVENGVLKPSLKNKRLNLIQSKIDVIEERLSRNVYLDEILELLGQ